MATIPKNSVFSNATEVYGRGDYFVSAMDGGQYWLMAGPYASHDEAADAVDHAKEIADKHDARAWFMAWGVCRLDPGSGRNGNLNRAGLI
jgi:hypothetical protein